MHGNNGTMTWIEYHSTQKPINFQLNNRRKHSCIKYCYLCDIKYKYKIFLFMQLHKVPSPDH